ncbi:heme-binding beta-barrel domain-containing protein [Streptomyces sp. NPDC005402]|uniref:heme-binding beta-barrel domain-containing protein n=1 Tax=Streptomyces sp. NPDC005402 TaxID=3155338 RepID=UPI0033A891D6
MPAGWLAGWLADQRLHPPTGCITPTAKEVTATRRRYALADTLDFVHDRAAVGQPPQHHLSATLHRAVGQSTPPASSWNSSVQ